jgi:hypothetical protein
MKPMKNLGALLALAALADMSTQPKGRKYVEPKEKPIPPIPKGHKVYYFTNSGEISNSPTANVVTALNEKNAIKKFNKTK